MAEFHPGSNPFLIEDDGSVFGLTLAEQSRGREGPIPAPRSSKDCTDLQRGQNQQVQAVCLAAARGSPGDHLLGEMRTE